jgi:hypothetical protein
MQKVKVYRFKKFNTTTWKEEISPRLATREAIAIFEGVLIEESVQEVDVSLLDEEQCISVEKK